jgi:serine/threonine protein kinase
LENLQNAGICHRDMSLENLLVHNESGALIIDMGMCLRIPFVDDPQQVLLSPFQQYSYPQLTSSMQNMSMTNGHQAIAANHNGAPVVAGRSRPRALIRPQGTCGKWIYMSPEIYRDKDPFDGYAVDVWAAGVILFLMLTGFPPWERACPTDERFKFMTAGYLVQMLTEWNLGLSGDALDLLQRMLFLDPKDRLSLDQVRAHPWMVNGPLAPPATLPGF